MWAQSCTGSSQHTAAWNHQNRGREEKRKEGWTEIPFLELSPETRAEGRAVAGSAEVKVLADVGSIILFSLDTVF